MNTVVHVTHEAVQKIGGIGAVLQGLLTASNYQKHIDRTILIGPMLSSGEGGARLGKGGKVLYSSLDGLDKVEFSDEFKKIEEKYNIALVYGKRPFRTNGQRDETIFHEVLLVESSHINQDEEDRFKRELFDRFGIESDRYEDVWEYEQYLRIAEPGYDALEVLLSEMEDDDGDNFVISHEFMGIPFVLKAIIDGRDDVKTIFYAHEVATVRPIVEEHPGHDTMFYNVLDAGVARGQYLEDIFGSQKDFFKHVLIKATKHCDKIFAVGDSVVKELRFLDKELRDKSIDLVYNGIPSFELSIDEKFKSKNRLQTYANTLLGFTPDYVMTHVTRLVKSKGIWRDLRVLEHLEPLLRANERTAVLFILSTEIGTGRSESDIYHMESGYGWPVNHRVGYPDLVGAEIDLNEAIEEFNDTSDAIKIVFVNQFGWNQERCGSAMPADMEFMDIRKGSDVEFGQSIYEPFGIAQVEPLSFGAICVISNVCGCRGFIENVTDGKGTSNVIVADYTKISHQDLVIDNLLSIGQPQRDEIEASNSWNVAAKLIGHLPRSKEEMAKMIERGYEVGRKMSWEVVAEKYFWQSLGIED